MIKEPPQIQYLNKLGEGAYGCVFMAKYKKTGEMIAIKRIKIDTQDQGLSSTTLRQISILKKLKHPNIIKLLDFYIYSEATESHIELSFEYMDEDLSKNMKRIKKYDQNVIKNIMRQIVEGLSYIHEEKVLHRDLKPQNILINGKGEIKIADFGLGRIVSKRLQTMSKEIETLWYRSPELLFGTTRYDYSVDIWSLGCVFYELAEGKVLFQGQSQIGQIMQIMKFCGTPSLSYWPEVLNMPYFKPKFPKFEHNRRYFSNLCEDGIDLLGQMINMNPKKRILIVDIMKHQYFNEK